MSHEVNFPDYLWRLAQQASGMSNPASWIRDRIGELLTADIPEEQREIRAIGYRLAGAIADDPLAGLGIYAKTDRQNFLDYALVECDSDETLAVKALASKDNPTAFLQWWADKQTETN